MEGQRREGLTEAWAGCNEDIEGRMAQIRCTLGQELRCCRRHGRSLEISETTARRSLQALLHDSMENRGRKYENSLLWECGEEVVLVIQVKGDDWKVLKEDMHGI